MRNAEHPGRVRAGTSQGQICWHEPCLKCGVAHVMTKQSYGQALDAALAFPGNGEGLYCTPAYKPLGGRSRLENLP